MQSRLCTLPHAKPGKFAQLARGEHKTRVTGDEGQETVIPTILRKKGTIDSRTIFRFVLKQLVLAIVTLHLS